MCLSSAELGLKPEIGSSCCQSILIFITNREIRYSIYCAYRIGTDLEAIFIRNITLYSKNCRSQLKILQCFIFHTSKFL